MSSADDPHSAVYFNDQRDFWFNDDWLRLLARRLGLHEVRCALDVGAGQGHWTLLLAPLLASDAEIVGVEREPEWVQRAGDRARERGLDREEIIYEGGAGLRAPGESGSVDAGTRFRIMSMTKMVATVAALQLIEQSKLDLDAPVEEYCPDFARVQVLERVDGEIPVLRAPASTATVKQLITHTSGLGYWFWNAGVVEWEQATGTPNVIPGSNAIFNAPMVADPGTRFNYGINTDWLGRVVEAAGGKGLDETIAAGITEPLGMNDTAFRITEEQLREATPVQLRGEDGAWAASEIELATDPDWWAGGHGLYSTPHDHLKFQRMLLGNGTSPDGVQILSGETVDAAFTTGYKWGYGLLLNTHDEPGRRRAGTGAWPVWPTRTTGWTAAPESRARSTRSSFPSSRRRP